MKTFNLFLGFVAIFLLTISAVQAGPFLVCDPWPLTDTVLNGVYIEMPAPTPPATLTCAPVDISGKTRVTIPIVNNAFRFDLGQIGTGVTTGTHYYCLAGVDMWAEGDFSPFSFTKAKPVAPNNPKVTPQ